MFQNIKVDVIYYKTNTDFEMEFNLCGCCRMRLLTDKAPDKKTLVHSLARAVSRSRVVIIAGNLFGEDSIINIAASATGSKLTIADNKTYGIDSDTEIQIISGSTPLVTPEGYFGGCIIEKGPQTMILLSDNKNVRKSVMKTLIHPYIEELCAINLKEKAALASAEAQPEPTPVGEKAETPESAVAEVEPEIELPAGEEAPAAEEAVPAAKDDEFVCQDESEDIADENTAIEHEGEIYDFVTDDDEPEEADENEMELVTEEEYEEIEMQSSDSDIFTADDDDEVDSDLLYNSKGISLKDFERRNLEYYNGEETVEGLIAEDDEAYIEKGEFKGNLNIPIIIVAILLFCLMIVVCYCLFYVPSKSGISPVSYLKDIYNTLFG